MTIDSGEAYLVDYEDRETGRPLLRIDRFNAATGAFISQFHRPPESPGEFIFRRATGIAVGHAGGKTSVYVVSEEPNEGVDVHVINVYDPAGTLQATWRGSETPSGSFGCCEAAGLAVDNSQSLGDWAAGDVYVPEPQHNVVDVYEPETGSGEKKPIAELTGVSPSEPFNHPTQVAVSAVNGDVTVGDASGVHIFQPAALPGSTNSSRPSPTSMEVPSRAGSSAPTTAKVTST